MLFYLSNFKYRLLQILSVFGGWLMINEELQQFYQEITSILENSQFQLSTPLLGFGGCFDLVAKKQNLLLLIKIVLNIDSLREEQTFELRKLSIMLEGFPLIVGKRIRNNVDIEDGVVYTRYEIPAVSVATLHNLLINHLPPLIYACRGGFKVKFDGALLKEKRLAKNYSMGNLAQEIGVSKRTIYEYEHGTVDVSLETALKIEEILNEPLTIAINLFEDMKRIGSLTTPTSLNNRPKSDIEREVKEHFDTLGLTDQLWTKKIPIRVLARYLDTEKGDKSTTTVTGISEEPTKEDVVKKVRVTYNISKIAEVDPLLIIGSSDTPNKLNVDGVPILSIDELLKKKKKSKKTA